MAPQKELRSDTGTSAAQELTWAWPWTLQTLPQPQAAANACLLAGSRCARF